LCNPLFILDLLFDFVYIINTNICPKQKGPILKTLVTYCLKAEDFFSRLIWGIAFHRTTTEKGDIKG
jgi:hypothetical protein